MEFRKTIAVITVALMGSAVGLHAAQVDSSAGKQAVPWVKLNNNARAAAMGEATVAIADDVNIISANPAGLAVLTGQQVALMHHMSFQDQVIEHMAYSFGLTEGSTIGASLDYIDFGTIPGYEVVNGSLVATGDLKSSGMAVNFGYGQTIGAGISLGAVAKYISQDLAGETTNGFAADLGALWEQGETGMSCGVSVLNVGGEFDGDDLPTNVKVGAGYVLAIEAVEAGALTAAVDVNVPTVATDATSYGAGIEFTGSDFYAVRAGYKASGNDGPSGMTVGGGIKFNILQLDYAFGDQGTIGSIHQISMLVKF